VFEWIANPEAWVALATLTALEIVLGIDNIIFISILVARLPEHQRDRARTIGLALAMIMRLGLLFSIAWVMAVGLADDVSVMAIAIVIAVGVMLLAAKAIGEFVDANPTIKILALSFLIMVGMVLVAEGLDFHVPKGYVYFAMAFSVTVELINIRMRARVTKPASS